MGSDSSLFCCLTYVIADVYHETFVSFITLGGLAVAVLESNKSRIKVKYEHCPCVCMYILYP